VDNLRTKPWFEVWFDSPYYALLYRKRDETEARQFIDVLLQYLKPSENATMLDIACGRGRHAIYLASLGYDVTGIDLSENNIIYARQFEHSRLHFYKHDMRQIFRINYYDYVFNFFTSFGYFDSEADNIKALKAIAKALKPDGVLVIDFLNVAIVLQQLPSKTTETIDNVLFVTEKKIEKDYIIKYITVIDGKMVSQFTESIRAITLDQFEEYFKTAGLLISGVFGNYQLHPFDARASERLIIIGQKKI
jgi:SAM-dependent methyltransferase